MRHIFTVVAGLALAPLPAWAVPVSWQHQQAAVGRKTVALSVLKVDLSDPQTLLKVEFANGADQPDQTNEAFSKLVQRTKPAAAINGTFFSTDTLEVFGNFITAGRVARYVRWDDRGTAFTVTRQGSSMLTMRAEGWPDYKHAWLSVACGPRLLKDGFVWLFPREEGFQYDHVFMSMGRSAMGLSRDGRTLYLVTFLTAVTLEQEAEAMKKLGAYQAMNLDGGGSIGAAYRGRVLYNPGRALTNVLLVYDSKNPAPATLKDSFKRFWQEGTLGGEQIGDQPPPHLSPEMFSR